jgi:aminoglycoside/choline kinase family phosphotransferase
MDAPPELENNTQFIALAERFRDAGIGVPEVLAFDPDRGFLLVEDLGDTLYESAYQGADRDAALESALRTLITLQRLPADASVPPYTSERFIDELGLFREWLLQGWLGLDLSPAERQLLDDVSHLLLGTIEDQPETCVHRDYHCRNLIWRPDHTTGVVDFQDALWGPISYDLASLLRDCYVRFSESEIDRWRNRYLELAAAADLLSVSGETFARWLDLTALQRQLKAMGIFARLQMRDGRGSHLHDIPRVLDHAISVALRYPATAQLGSWLDDRVRPALAAKA